MPKKTEMNYNDLRLLVRVAAEEDREGQRDAHLLDGEGAAAQRLKKAGLLIVERRWPGIRGSERVATTERGTRVAEAMLKRLRHAAYLALLALVVACGGEPFESALFREDGGGAAGEAGSAGQAGSGGSAGEGGSAGNGGSAGEAGSGGSAGALEDAGPDVEPPCPKIEVKSAVYAASCNVATTLSTVFTECDGLSSCDYVMNNAKDPGSDIAPGCWKDLTIIYSCDGETKSAYHEKTWDDLVVSLDCECER